MGQVRQSVETPDVADLPYCKPRRKAGLSLLMMPADGANQRHS